MTDDDQFDTSLDESGRLRLYTTCPVGHPTIQAFTPMEWREGLASEALVFQCLYCAARWKPPAMQRSAIASELEA